MSFVAIFRSIVGMAEFALKIASALEGFFHSKFLSVVFVSMFPVVEVRGGIPLGLSLEMSPGMSYLAAIVAGFIVVPIILFLLKKVISWMCKSKHMGKFGEALNNYFNKKAQKVEDGNIVKFRDKEIFKYIALYVFVAAPLPLTGFWTGSAIAVFMNLKPLKSMIAIFLGNLTAGGLILLISLVMGDKAYIITVIFAILLPVVIGIMIFKMVMDKKRRAKLAECETGVEEAPQNVEEDVTKEN